MAGAPSRRASLAVRKRTIRASNFGPTPRWCANARSSLRGGTSRRVHSVLTRIRPCSRRIICVARRTNSPPDAIVVRCFARKASTAVLRSRQDLALARPPKRLSVECPQTSDRGIASSRSGRRSVAKIEAAAPGARRSWICNRGSACCTIEAFVVAPRSVDSQASPAVGAENKTLTSPRGRTRIAGDRDPSSEKHQPAMMSRCALRGDCSQ